MSDNPSCIEDWHREGDSSSRVIFLLTKPPDSERTKLCFRLIEKSKNPVLFLAGDGVYNLLNGFIDLLALDRIYVCKEDIEARGVPSKNHVILPEDFYGQLVKDVMLYSHRSFTF